MAAPRMKVQEFLRLLPEMVHSQLPEELRGFHTVGPFAGLVKLHYGDRRRHYEVWVQQRLGIVEMGLHFEGDPEDNQRHLENLSRRFAEIASVLGPSVEPEQWTRSWTRLHETLPLPPLDEGFAFEVSQRLAAMIRVLEPMVRQAL